MTITKEQCDSRHWWIRWGFGLLLPLITCSLAMGGSLYLYIAAETSDINARVMQDRQKLLEQVNNVEIKVASGTVERQGIQSQLNGIVARQQRMEDKTDRILETVTLIRQNGGRGGN